MPEDRAIPARKFARGRWNVSRRGKGTKSITIVKLSLVSNGGPAAPFATDSLARIIEGSLVHARYALEKAVFDRERVFPPSRASFFEF